MCDENEMRRGGETVSWEVKKVVSRARLRGGGRRPRVKSLRQTRGVRTSDDRDGTRQHQLLADQRRSTSKEVARQLQHGSRLSESYVFRPSKDQDHRGPCVITLQEEKSGERQGNQPSTNLYSDPRWISDHGESQIQIHFFRGAKQALDHSTRLLNFDLFVSHPVTTNRSANWPAGQASTEYLMFQSCWSRGMA